MDNGCRILDFISNRLDWETRNMPYAIKKSEPRTVFILSSWKDHWQLRFPPSVKWGQTYVCPLEEFSVGLTGELGVIIALRLGLVVPPGC